MPSAPFAISSQSRKKLKAFAFDGTSTGRDENKENGQDSYITAQVNIEQSSGNKPKPNEILPQTPATRIPIEDLIGNTEDAFNCPPPIATPADHVLWHNGPGSSCASASQNGTQKSRKRRRSSSPASSQLEQSTHFQGNRDSMNMESVQRSLRTPNDDPTQELWNRYMSANAMRKDDGEPNLPAFASLLPSSPQTPSTTSKDGGLRRTVSCGVEWPTSRPKRRKVDVGITHSRTKDIFAASRKDILAQDITRQSRVGLLVEKIQETLSKRQVAQESPASSSPLPERFSQIQASPTKATYRQPSKSPRPHSSAPQRGSPLKNRHMSESSSEFGDDGLDMEFFEIAQNDLAGKDVSQKSINHNHMQSVMKSTSCVYSLPDDLQDRKSPSKSPVRKLSQPNKLTIPTISFDEFDDDEDDTLTNELQDLAAKFESQDGQCQTGSVHKSAQSLPTVHEQDEFDDTFDDDDDDLWKDMAIQPAVTKPVGVGTTSQKNMDNRTIKRYLILDVAESHYENTQGRRRPEKMLSVKDERTKLLYAILLRQSWYETRCTKGSYVHIIGEFNQNAQCIIDDNDNMIILHPDHLISSTVVGDSFTCLRRAALQDRVKATSQATQPQVYGHIIHEVFGEALRLNRWDSKTFEKVIRQLIPNYIEALYEIGVSIAVAIEYVLSKTPELSAWACVFVGDSVVQDAVIRDRNGGLVPTAINKLLELEEHVWSPMYGLKGNIDATVQAQMHVPGEAKSKTLVVPLELKTGKKDNNESHRAQTALYTLLLSDRYDVNVTCGILYYLETSKTFRVESIRNEIRHMIIQRNELACYVHDKLDLPPMLKRSHMCKSCYSKTQCFTYHRLVENGDGETSGLGETFTELVNHLSPSHQSFFKKWDDLLTKEERDTMKFRRELWTMLSTERQAVGRSFSNVMIEPGSAQENLESTKINRFTYTFVKYKAEPGFSFTDSQITIGEPIVISDELGHFNLAAGYVTNVRPMRIVVAVDRRLQNARIHAAGFNADHNQVFTGLMDSALDGTPLNGSTQDAPRMFRIDKDEFSNGMATARNNLIRIMEKDLFMSRELRQLIVDTKAPTFTAPPSSFRLTGPASQQNLNTDQRRAIEKVMSAKDYALVLGMPGTGKTTTIAHIIRALVSQNKSVLLASYTHTAVDNILLKIKDDKIPILRIGAVTKVHPEVQKFADLTGIPKKTIEELDASWHNNKVVATTCLSITHGLFNARTFDYCIVDEASQITLPVCLGPIRMAKTFVLVGDHYQLPPLVQNKEAQEGGLNVSLFKLLSDAHPESVVNLEHQYRMAEDIMLLSKELVYSGRLKCGTQEVAARMLSIPGLENGLAAHHYNGDTTSSLTQVSMCTSDQSCWLRKALIPSSRCIFLNTDTISPKDTAKEIASGSRITNATESMLTAQIVTTLIRSGVSPPSIGVITFYRSQLAFLKRDIKAMAGTNASSEVEMHTADKYQGRDKEVIVLSCVRSNESNHVGELLRDWRRVNVAVTRARSKLIILGSKTTLFGSEVPILQGIVRIMDGKGWMNDLPGDALNNHLFESSQFTQTQLPRTTKPKDAIMQSPQQSRQDIARSPPHARVLQETSANTISKPSPQRPTDASINIKRATFKQKPFRIPSKIKQGQRPADSMHKLLDTRPVMNDVLNDMQDMNDFDQDFEDTENIGHASASLGGLIGSSPLIVEDF